MPIFYWFFIHPWWCMEPVSCRADAEIVATAFSLLIFVALGVEPRSGFRVSSTLLSSSFLLLLVALIFVLLVQFLHPIFSTFVFSQVCAPFPKSSGVASKLKMWPFVTNNAPFLMTLLMCLHVQPHFKTRPPCRKKSELVFICAICRQSGINFYHKTPV